MNVCKKCGFENVDEAKFCINCGESIIEEAKGQKKSNLAMILGIIACSLFIVYAELSNVVTKIFEYNFSLYMAYILKMFFVAPIIIVSAIGLAKSIKSKNLPGLIMNPIALGISAIIAVTSLGDFILALFGI